MGGWVPERDLEKSSKQTAGTNTKGAKDTPTTKDTSANDNTDSAKPTREPDEVQTTGNASSSAETLKPKNAVVIEGDIQQSTQLTNRGMPTTENVKGIAAEPDSRCYELRIYYAAPEKLDALKARFRDHTCTLFEKHDLANVGYWTPLENPDNKLVYILSSPSREAHDKAWKEFAADPEWKKVVQETEANGKLVTKVDSVFLKATDFSPAIAPSGTQTPRCFELRTYTAAPGKMDALLARFRDHTLALFTKHGMTHIGYWTRTDEGPSQLIYILAHQSKDAAAKSFESFRADPAWIEAKKDSETNGSLTEKVESVFMTPVDFSPIK